MVDGFEGERVLVVEDEESVREFARRALSKNGYMVLVAADAQEAFDIFEKEGRNLDLIFTDVVLPGDDGPKLADLFLRLKPGISILLTTGYSDERSVSSVLEERGYPYLHKPYSLENLLRSVKDALKKGRKRPGKQ